jgi:hypothetical protein
MPETGGKMGASGDLHAEKNPSPAPKRGAQFVGNEITARLGPDGLTVRVIGRATYGSRTISTSAEADAGELDAIEKALRAVLDDHADAIEERTMEAAYEASRVARIRGEDI